MKERILYLFCIMIVSGDIVAQNVYKGQIRISGQHVHQRNNILQIEMDINYNGLEMDTNESLTLIPFLQSPDHRLDLPSLIINGVQAQKAYHRAEILGKSKTAASNNTKTDLPMAVLEYDRKKANDFNYKAAIPYQDWMQGGLLFIESKECNCNGRTGQVFRERVSETLSTDSTQTTTPGNSEEIYLTPATENSTEAPRKPATEISPEVDYRVLTWIEILPAPGEESTDLTAAGYIPLNNPRFFQGDSKRKLNHEVRNKLLEAVREVRQVKGVSISEIDITGFSSPIGNFKRNERKAPKRVLSLKKSLYDASIAGQSTLNVRWTAEDWDSITSLVRQSDMMFREATLDLIRNVDVSKGREDMLRQLAGGVPYRYLCRQVFPQVWRVEYTIRFRYQTGTDEKKLLVQNHEEALTIAEFFALALTYPWGSAEFNDIFDLAARVFPDSPEANINAAAIALTRGDTYRARNYLERFTTLPEANCNMGILYLLEGNKEKAEVYLEMARTNGIVQAAGALEYLKNNKE